MKRYWLTFIPGVTIVLLGTTCTQTDVVEVVDMPDVQLADEIEQLVVEPEPEPEVTTIIFYTSDLTGLDSNFNFSVEIPAQWEVENVAEIQSINFYDPAAVGETNLDKSQVFVRYFLAQEFLTLTTVTIHSSTPLTINGHETMEYDIEKKASVADFPSQPAWRNQRHTVTDIRVSPNSSVFYVFGQRPDLDTAVRDQFFQSLDIVE